VSGDVSEACLVLTGSGKTFPLDGGRTWAIGRGEGCAIQLDSRSVSRLHALIQRRDAGDYYLVDLGSRNGSFVNRRRVSLPLRLQDQDRLVFAEQDLLFRNPSGTSTQATTGHSTRNLPTESLHNESLATILVVDIRDFTALARTVSEALLSQTIGTWFLQVGQAAERRGSWAQQYIGDAVMAVWVHEDASKIRSDVMQVLEALCEIYRGTEEVSRSLPLPKPLRIGAGVSTGTVILGGTDYTALGDTVNAAFRLEAATKTIGLGVVLGQRAFEALDEGQQALFQRRELQLKGYETPATAWAISFDDLMEQLAPRSRGA